MGYFLLFYETCDDYFTRRAALREDHLNLAPDGAVLVFKGESPKVAEQFATNDPYVHNGLITKWYIRPWTVVIGG